ncbi:MAG: crotonase/enoyl-CoA hydratase family protein [Actinomycetota bacterium]
MTVHYEVRDRIAVVTIDNGKANALAPEIVAAIGDAYSRAEAAGEEAVGAVLLTATPGMFSGGFDLAVMRSGPEAAGTLVTDGGELIARMYGGPVPLVIACTGHAIAAGALLLMGADARVGTVGEYRIGLIETQIGMVLPRWAVELSFERLSPVHLQDATVGARIYDPEGAVAAGFLDRAVPAADLEAEAFAEAQRWAAFPRSAYRGQVHMARGERLARLADAIAADRGRGFGVPGPA